MPSILTLEGLDMAIDDYGRDDFLDGFGGLADLDLFNPEALREALYSGLGGGAAGGLYAAARRINITRQQTIDGQTVPLTEPLLNSRIKRLGAASLLAVVGGWGAWQLKPSMSMGVVGAMTSN